VKFNATNYLADAKTAETNLEEEVKRMTEDSGTNLPPGAKTPEEAMAKYRDLILNTRAQQIAQRRANEFAAKLDQANSHSNDMEAIAKSAGLVAQTTPPFDESGPEGLKVPEMFVLNAFHLGPDMPYSGLIGAEDGAYVLGFKERIPAKVPALKDVEAKVTADMKEQKARELALDAAASFSKTLDDELNVNNGVTLPKDFATIAAENDLKVETMPAISPGTTNLPGDLEQRVTLGLLRNVAFSTAPRTASRARPAPEGAMVLYVERMLDLDQSKLQAELPRYLAALRARREGEAFQYWINNEMNHDAGFVASINEFEKNQGGGAPDKPKK